MGKLYLLMQNPKADDYAIGKDFLTFYAERRSELGYLGIYGGDAYPAVFDGKKPNGERYGAIFVSDGVGGGAFLHESLEKWVEPYASEEEKLYEFLQALYGEEFFDDEEALSYALRCFSPFPFNCFYATDTGKAQEYVPFYRRDSQSLASRIVCIGVYYRFRKEFFDRELSPQSAAELRQKIEEYVFGRVEDGVLKAGELRERVLGIFNNRTDGTQNAHRNRYFLPCTFSACFYETAGEKVKFVSINVGDSRCYKVDTVDGVMQISEDDAEPDGAMSCIVRFCENYERESGKRDCSFQARYGEADMPCALFCCSDGVYDTCQLSVSKANFQQVALNTEGGVFSEYDHLGEANDTAFELNMQQLLRQAYSLDDVRKLLVGSLYVHANPKGWDADGARTEIVQGGAFDHIKFDDSATLGMSFFSKKEGFPEILDALRTTKTTLDAVKEETDGTRYCYTMPPVVDIQAKKQDLLIEKLSHPNLFGVVSEAVSCAMKQAMEEAKSRGESEYNFLGTAMSDVKSGFKLKLYLKQSYPSLIEVLKADDEALTGRSRLYADQPTAEELQALYSDFLEKLESLEAAKAEYELSLTKDDVDEQMQAGQKLEECKEVWRKAKRAMLNGLDGHSRSNELRKSFDSIEDSKNYPPVFPCIQDPPFLPEDWVVGEHLICSREAYDGLCEACASIVNGCHTFGELYDLFVKESEAECEDPGLDRALESYRSFRRMAYGAVTSVPGVDGVVCVGGRELPQKDGQGGKVIEEHSASVAQDVDPAQSKSGTEQESGVTPAQKPDGKKGAPKTPEVGVSRKSGTLKLKVDGKGLKRVPVAREVDPAFIRKKKEREIIEKIKGRIADRIKQESKREIWPQWKNCEVFPIDDRSPEYATVLCEFESQPKHGLINFHFSFDTWMEWSKPERYEENVPLRDLVKSFNEFFRGEAPCEHGCNAYYLTVENGDHFMRCRQCRAVYQYDSLILQQWRKVVAQIGPDKE